VRTLKVGGFLGETKIGLKEMKEGVYCYLKKWRAFTVSLRTLKFNKARGLCSKNEMKEG
jgi:hypothetical protein